MALVLLSQTSRTRSPRALALRNVDGTSPPDQRWASADLSPGFSIQIQAWPIHKTRPKSRSQLCRRIDNVSSREVSRHRPTLSITGSMCRQPLLCSLASKTRALFLRSLRSLASFAPSIHEDAFLSATPFSKPRAHFFLLFLPFVPRARLFQRN